MPYYKVCEICGSTLDPQEKCNCEQEKKEAEEQKQIEKMVQVTFNLIKNSRGKQK